MDKVNEDNQNLNETKMTSPEPRENMIETAIKFLQNPKVRQSPFSQRKTFLQRKGLNDEEIRIAIERSGTAGDETASLPVVQSHTNMPIMSQPMQAQPVSKWSKTRDILASAIVVGGMGYALYILYKRYLYPFWFGPSKEEQQMEQLTQSMLELQQNMAQTLTQIQETQALLTRQQDSIQELVQSNNQNNETKYEANSMRDVKEEIKSLKALLLSSKRFAAAPATIPVIPTWQLTPVQVQTHAAEAPSETAEIKSSTTESESEGMTDKSLGNASLQDENKEGDNQISLDDQSLSQEGSQNSSSPEDEQQMTSSQGDIEAETGNMLSSGDGVKSELQVVQATA